MLRRKDCVLFRRNPPLLSTPETELRTDRPGTWHNRGVPRLSARFSSTARALLREFVHPEKHQDRLSTHDEDLINGDALMAHFRIVSRQAEAGRFSEGPETSIASSRCASVGGLRAGMIGVPWKMTSSDP